MRKLLEEILLFFFPERAIPTEFTEDELVVLRKVGFKVFTEEEFAKMNAISRAARLEMEKEKA